MNTTVQVLEMILLLKRPKFACTSCEPILFEVARTYQSYRASLILAYSEQGALIVCTLLPGALDSYRDRINCFPQLNISLNSGAYSRIPANTPDNFNLFLGSPCLETSLTTVPGLQKYTVSSKNTHACL